MSLPSLIHGRKPHMPIKELIYSLNALHFDGATTYVNCGADPSLNITTQLTLMIWINFSVSQISRTIAGRYEAVARAYVIGISDATNNIIKFFTRTSTVVDTLFSIRTYNDGKRHRVVGTWDGVTKRLYVDGQEVNSVACGGTMAGWGATDFNIGALFLGVYCQFFNGAADEVVLLNRVWTPAEILEDFHRGYAKVESNVVLCIRMEEGTGLMAEDLSPNGNDGNLLPVATPPTWRRVAKNELLTAR